MKSANRMKLRTFLLTVFICFTVYVSLTPFLFELNLLLPFAG